MKVFVFLIGFGLSVFTITGADAAGFNCDPTSKKCTCSGTWESADCKAMSRNCSTTGDVHHACSAGGCICYMDASGGDSGGANNNRPIAPVGAKPMKQ
jgi:hypothetical protein